MVYGPNNTLLSLNNKCGGCVPGLSAWYVHVVYLLGSRKKLKGNAIQVRRHGAYISLLPIRGNHACLLAHRIVGSQLLLLVEKIYKKNQNISTCINTEENKSCSFNLPKLLWPGAHKYQHQLHNNHSDSIYFASRKE